jgi:hypothetical protein
MSLTGDSALTLAWSDFQGTPPASATRKAFTSTTFDIQTPFIFRVDGRTKKQTDFRVSGVTVDLTLERSKMWLQASAQTSTLLRHEQGHYEITALLMRDLESDLTALWQSKKTYPTLNDLKKDVDSIKQPILSLHTSMQSVANPKGGFIDGAYDQQTKDGTDAKVQASWNAAFTAARATPPVRLTDALAAQNITVP